MDDESKQLLENIEKWTKVLAQDKIQKDLELFSEEKKRVYELSTEERSNRDIAGRQDVDVSRETVRNWRNSWFKQGLMEKQDVHGGRVVRLDSLENFGIDVPDLEDKSNE